MIEGLAASSLSVHVRCTDAGAVAQALLRLGVGRGKPVPVWPPHPLPHGLFLSPVRQGWVSIWSPLEDVREWFPPLAATLECPGVLLEVIESEFWIAELFHASEFLGRVELPTDTVAWDDLWARANESLAAEGVEEPWLQEERLQERMESISTSEEYQDDLRRLRDEQPAAADLQPFLPPHATVERAWELLSAIDRRGEGDEDSPYAEDYLEAFAGYLGIRDAAWNPFADAQALAEGDYEDEEGLPEQWQEFRLLPLAALRVLDS